MKRIEMIGSPLAHVRTPALLNARLAGDGLALRVMPREIEAADLVRYVAATRREDAVAGLVVTTPLKEAICGHLDRRTALVELIGSCNCVRVDGGSWIGANFDGFGFARALAEAGVTLAGKRVLLMGCGGAGKAIAERVARAVLRRCSSPIPWREGRQASPIAWNRRTSPPENPLPATSTSSSTHRPWG